jgi:hypothetical protein
MKKIFLLLFLGIFLIGIASAATTCCEKTTSGAWCQNVNDATQCNSAFRSISSFCESTSYCKVGTCINQQMGTCTSSTQVVCGNGGLWSDKQKSELPQCKNGCCLIGDGASFVTQVACNKQSSDYAVTATFNPSITDEQTCLAMANPQTQGACVYTKDYTKTCELISKKECQDKAKSSSLSGVEFHDGYLCSAQELGTVCGKSTKTKCDNKGDVRFVDTCGNLANIYDSSKVNDENYWTKIQAPTCTTASNPGNKDSATCGECDYYSGSMCQVKKTGDTLTGGTLVGNNFCKNLDCKDYRGPYGTGKATATNYPRHGETWCATDTGTGYENKLSIVGNGDNLNATGNNQFKLACYNGEVTNSLCDLTRQEVCSQNDTIVSGHKYYEANCKKNLWQDTSMAPCFAQTAQSDCEDINYRDCIWISSYGYSFVSGQGLVKNGASGVCVPKYAPGFERDAAQNNKVIGGQICQAASAGCQVVMVKIGFSNSWECKKNEGATLFNGFKSFSQDCSCIGGAGHDDGGVSWGNQLNKICTQLGDCGIKKNYVGDAGYPFNQITTQTVG